MWAGHRKVTITSDIAQVFHLISQSFARPSTPFYADEDDVRLIQTFYVTVSNTAWQCRLRPILSALNQLTRLNTVSTMSRLETSPTSTRPASTANFILIPLIGTPGLSAMAPGLPSFPSPGCAAPAVSSLAIAKEGRTGQVAFTGKAPVHRWCESSRCRRRKRALSPLQLSCWQSTRTQSKRFPPHPKQLSEWASKVGDKGAKRIC